MNDAAAAATKIAYTLHHTYYEEQSGRWIWVYRPEGERYATRDRCVAKDRDARRLGSVRWFVRGR